MLFVTGFVLVITLVNIIVYYLGQKHEEEQKHVQRTNLSLLSSSGLQCRRFSLAEIKCATQNFDAGLVIGKGGFGDVYRGIIDNGATTVAIKRLGILSGQGAPEFWTEIEMLSKFRHSHLVRLIGYCNEHPEMIIVYEYMPGGTLADNLHKMRGSRRPLSWIQRLKACLGAARGLDYLHTGTDIQTRVIHRDVKSTNILLDANCDAKISDFGLSKIGPAEQIYTHVSTRVKGTFGYMDPEYLWTRRLTRKSDVYAFGVVMLEALCGRPALDRNLDEGLAKWAKRCIKEGRLYEIVDPHLNGTFLSDCLKAFAKIAEQCLHGSSRKRPTMAEVVTRLEYVLSLQEGTSFSLVDEGIITSGENFDRQEGANSSLEPDDKHAENLIQHQIQVTKKLTYVQKAWRFFSTKDPVTDPVVSAYSSFQSPYLKCFSWAELNVATDNFSNKNIVGRGGFGKVYKGRLLDGSLVAIKRARMDHAQAADSQFQNEINFSFMTKHRNLCCLRGFCAIDSPSPERLLVYPYMANGSVASLLRERNQSQSALDWNTRKQIALQAARGLAYLHDDCMPVIIHRDVKAANILLDEDFGTYIKGFELVKLMDHECTHVSTAIRGTIGHIAPEYLSTGNCSPKTDVFAYGVVLMELITGQRAFDLARLANDNDFMLLDWVKGLLKEKKMENVIDPDLQGIDIYEEVEHLTQVALFCTQYSPAKRPTMSHVVRILEGTDGLAERWEEWQKENIPIPNPIPIPPQYENLSSEMFLSPR